MARLVGSEEACSTITNTVPLRPFGTKRDLANLVLFLCSDLASYISGANIPVDGGWVANGARGIG
jgi:NAD(P)-dependent dehydrogenase (short-subunit alcohol dehydrogenase family)